MKWSPRSLFFIGMLLFAIGVVVGVFCSQYSYFTIDKEISLSDLLIFLGGSVVTVYVATIISRSLYRLQSIHALYVDDIKEFIKFSTKLEDWIFLGAIPHLELVAHLKRGNIKLREIDILYKNNEHIQSVDFSTIIKKYNDLKVEITAISPNPTVQQIQLSSVQVNDFQNKYEIIKLELFRAIMKS